MGLLQTAIVANVTTGEVADTIQAYKKLNAAYYDVKADYGAAGDGVTDDRAAIQSAINACNTAGGGVVYIPAGTYRLTLTQPITGWYTCLSLKSRVRLLGAGRDVTILKMASGQTHASSNNNASVLLNANPDTGGTDNNITISHLTVDGNAPGNPYIQYHGVRLWRTYKVFLDHVRIIDWRGTDDNPSAWGESFGCDVLQAAHGSFVDSECDDTGYKRLTVTTTNGSATVNVTTGTVVSGDIGKVIKVHPGDAQAIPARALIKQINSSTQFVLEFIDHSTALATAAVSGLRITIGWTATGWSNDYSSHMSYIRCTGQHMAVGHGFTKYRAHNDQMVNCIAILNAGHGFNDEMGEHNLYQNCHAGTQAGNFMDGSPYTLSQNLGNYYAGFVMLGDATYGRYNRVDGCVSQNNYAGIQINEPRRVRVSDSTFINNFNGISVWTATSGAQLSASAEVETSNTVVESNTSSQFSAYSPGGGIAWTNTQALTAPAIPASTVAQRNYFMFGAEVYITGGTVTAISLTGTTGSPTATGITSGRVKVPAGWSITLTYSSAPTWTWFPA